MSARPAQEPWIQSQPRSTADAACLFPLHRKALTLKPFFLKLGFINKNVFSFKLTLRVCRDIYQRGELSAAGAGEGEDEHKERELTFRVKFTKLECSSCFKFRERAPFLQVNEISNELYCF